MLSDDLTDFARAIVQGVAPSSRMAALYVDYSVEVAIEVYRNNYRGNLHDALADVYPVIEQLVGQDFFRLVTRRFIASHPPQNGNLYHYGGQMADFLATFGPAGGLVYLPDVARLEWACHLAYFAEDAAALALADLARLPAERYGELKLHLHPACHLVRSRYPLGAIWHAHQPGGDFRIDLDSGPGNALVSRHEGAVSVTELSEAEATWLQVICDGFSLGAATDAALEGHPDFDLQALLLNLLVKDALTNFELGGET